MLVVSAASLSGIFNYIDHIHTVKTTTKYME